MRVYEGLGRKGCRGGRALRALGFRAERFTPGWHSYDAGVCPWAVHGATELQLRHSAPTRMAVGCCELRQISTPRYRFFLILLVVFNSR